MDRPDVIIDGQIPGVPGAVAREVPFLPDHLAGGRAIGPFTEATTDALLFAVPRIGRFLIRGGTMIEVWVAPGADRSAAKHILFGSALGTLIHQRGELALQAVAMITPSGAGVAICGSSAIGKSTLAVALSRRGWLSLGDGIVRVAGNSSGGIVWPGDTRLQMWRDACEDMGLNIGELEPVRQKLEKYFVPVPAIAVPTPLEFAVRLQAAAACSAAEFSPSQRPELFFQSTFKPRQLAALGQRDAHGRTVAQISRACRAMVLNGARQCAIPELADVLCKAVA